VAEHPYFRRHGTDIEVDLPLNLTEALLGCKKEVQTPEGTKIVNVPVGMSAGKKIRLKGLGFPTKVGGKERGDLYALVSFQIPKEFTDQQKVLLEQLRDSGL
jgi:molecular chaperone DnaJ